LKQSEQYTGGIVIRNGRFHVWKGAAHTAIREKRTERVGKKQIKQMVRGKEVSLPKRHSAVSGGRVADDRPRKESRHQNQKLGHLRGRKKIVKGNKKHKK